MGAFRGLFLYQFFPFFKPILRGIITQVVQIPVSTDFISIITNKLFFATFFQLNQQTKNVNLNARLQWRYKPASDLFIVYTDNYYADNYMSKGSALVLKATYWFNL